MSITDRVQRARAAAETARDEFTTAARAAGWTVTSTPDGYNHTDGGYYYGATVKAADDAVINYNVTAPADGPEVYAEARESFFDLPTGIYGQDDALAALDADGAAAVITLAGE